MIHGIKHLHTKIIDSTQNWAKRYLLSDNCDFNRDWYLFTAEEQTSGRGDFGKVWFSPAQRNIYATFAFKLLPQYQSLSTHIPQVLSLAACHLIEEKGLSPQIKWPNDIIIQEKKICGALCEVVRPPLSKDKTISYLLAGIGLNINLSGRECVAAGLNQPITSLKAECNKDFDVIEIINQLAEIFYKCIEVLYEKGFEYFLPLLKEKLAYVNTHVTVRENEKVLEGNFLGISESGEFILEMAGGKKISLKNARLHHPLKQSLNY